MPAPSLLSREGMVPGQGVPASGLELAVAVVAGVPRGDSGALASSMCTVGVWSCSGLVISERCREQDP